MRRPTRNRGFTLIETMATLVIFTVAVTGLASLQKVSSEGAHRGKRMTAATFAASYFLTQLRTEFGAWTQGENFTPANFPANQFPMLTASIGAGNAGVDAWLAIDEDTFRVDQYLGHSDLGTNDDGISLFCVNYMISPVETIPDAVDDNDIMVWSARVRVSWPKAGQFQENAGWKDCNPVSVEARIETNQSDDAIELVSFVSREFSQ